MKKLPIYYLVHGAINLTLLAIFRDNINIRALSLLPLFLMLLMGLQITLFHTDHKEDSRNDTAYSVGNAEHLTPDEQNAMYSYLRYAFLLLLPFELPLIFFLPSYYKLLGILPYICSYILGSIIFKVKMGKQIQIRIESEKKELEEQRKREELGQK